LSKFWSMLQSAFASPVPVPRRVEPEAQPHNTQDSQSSGTTIVLHCHEKQMALMENLSRYFEAPIPSVLSRGIFLLTHARDAEVQNKKLAIVEFDEESGKVTSVSPINI